MLHVFSVVLCDRYRVGMETKTVLVGYRLRGPVGQCGLQVCGVGAGNIFQIPAGAEHV